MTVKELIRFLEKFDPNMEVIHTRCSDYEIIREDMWNTVWAFQKSNESWLTRYHPSLPKSTAKEYLHLEGN